MRNRLYELLVEGDKRTVKYVDTAVQLLKTHPDLAQDAIALMRDESAAVAMRAADCLEKFSRDNANKLQPYAKDLVDILTSNSQQEVRWHLAQILPKLKLSSKDISRAADIWLSDFYNAKSSIVRTESLQALYEIKEVYPEILPDLKHAIPEGLEHGTPAVKARARKLSGALL